MSHDCGELLSDGDWTGDWVCLFSAAARLSLAAGCYVVRVRRGGVDQGRRNSEGTERTVFGAWPGAQLGTSVGKVVFVVQQGKFGCVRPDWDRQEGPGSGIFGYGRFRAAPEGHHSGEQLRSHPSLVQASPPGRGEDSAETG
uniref:(northern house mosquito) hypothetical protein n=1 Tax=Culex pipiens TaxID=7175 RepID=A0A8D8CWY3_CULPI